MQRGSAAARAAFLGLGIAVVSTQGWGADGREPRRFYDRATECAVFDMDCAAWMPTVSLQTANGVSPLGSHWLGALSTVAEIPGAKPETAPAADSPYYGPWHLDCRIANDLPSTKLVGRRFLASTLAGTLAAFMLMGTLCQLYVSHSLGADTVYWEQQMAQNKKLFDDLNRSTRALTAGAVAPADAQVTDDNSSSGPR